MEKLNGVVETHYGNGQLKERANYKEGKLNGLEGNRSLGNDILVGTFYVTGSDYDGNLCSLSDAEITEYTNQFLESETFKPEEIEATTGFTFLSF